MLFEIWNTETDPTPIFHRLVQVPSAAVNEDEFIFPMARVVITVQLSVHANWAVVQRFFVALSTISGKIKLPSFCVILQRFMFTLTKTLIRFRPFSNSCHRVMVVHVLPPLPKIKVYVQAIKTQLSAHDL